MEDACGFTWSWSPTDYLDNPNSVQPTVLDFDGVPFEYTLSVEPIGFENCAATDVVMVLPGFEYTTDFSDPTCLVTDGEITLNISEPPSEGPWDVVLSDLTGVLESQSFGGGLLAFDNLEAGNYSLEVSDQNGCAYVTDFDLADPLPPGITVSPDDIICIGGTSVLTASAASGGPYAFNWTVDGYPVGQGASLLVSPDVTTVYEVSGIDGAGCITQSGAVQVGIYDAFTVDIDAEDLICLGDEVMLSAINVTGGEGNGYSFEFSYEGTTFVTGNDDQVQFVPPLTGDFCVTVSEACSTPPETACAEVEVEQPYDLTLAADTTRGCVPQALEFTHSIPDAFVDNLMWDFGDGGDGTGSIQAHVYNEPGVYDVGLTVVTTTGCVNSTIADNYIQIFSPPSVGFTAGPQPTTAPETRIDFESSVSPTVVDWHWVFLPSVLDAVSFEPNPTYTFPMGNGGIYPVTLAVTDTNGCESQVTRNVEIYDFFNVYIPSAFTPNNDGFNDLWTVYGSDIDPDRFEMSVFNRWGERVFHTTDIDQGWLGQADDEIADPAQMYFSGDGTYVYRVVFYSESTNEKREVRGYINLTR
jgi:gliding motility-associated-like protein